MFLLIKECHIIKRLLSGEGDQIPGILPGDIILVLQQREHPIFKREGHDLYIDKKIQLADALCGFSFLITHLDGRSILVKSNPGDIIKPNDTKCIEGEGMPHYKNPFEKGRLFVRFEVEFPASGFMTPEKIKGIKSFLPKGTDIGKVGEDVEEVTLVESDIASNGKKQRRRGNSSGENYGNQYAESDEEEEEDGPQGHGVQCHQQ